MPKPVPNSAQRGTARMWAALLAATWLLCLPPAGLSVGPDLPPRPADAVNGSQFASLVQSLPLEERENRIAGQIIAGNVPAFYRSFVPVHVSGSVGGILHSVTYYAAPEYVAIGSDQDYLLMPMTPLLAQRLCDRLDCVLPTRKMVNQIWTNAAVKLDPQPIAPSPQMTTVPVFVDHNNRVRTQRNEHLAAAPLGRLVAGHKKDVILSGKIYTNFANASVTHPVVIYGWHYTSGIPIQPLYNGHQDTYADYSHGARLIMNRMVLDKSFTTVSQVLTNSSLAALLSDEGPTEGTTTGVIRRPFYPRSVPAPNRILSASLGINGELRATVSAIAGVTYEVQKSPDLENWNVFATLTASGSVMEFTDPPGAGPPAYYRIKRTTP